MAQIDHPLYPRYRQRRARVKGHHRAAQMRVHPHRRKAHTGQAYIDGELSGSRDLFHHVEPRHGTAKVFPLRRRAQFDLAGGADAGGIFGQILIAEFDAPRCDHAAIACLKAAHGDAQPICGCLFQHLARGGPRLAQLVIGIQAGGRPARHLQTDHFGQDRHRLDHHFLKAGAVVICRGKRMAHQACVEIGLRGGPVNDPDLVPCHVQLFGQQRGQGGVDTLPHLGARRDQRDAALINDDQRVQCHPIGAGVQRVGQFAAVLPDAECHAPGHGGRPDQERAACDLAPIGHASTLPQGDGGGMDGRTDPRIGAAAAQIARHGGVNIGIGGRGGYGQ